jgi:hypothetical protein
MLLLLKSATLFRVSRQVAYGLYELLKTSAANIHSDTDWSIIFTLLECVGAGAHPPRVVGDNIKDKSDQGLFLHQLQFLRLMNDIEFLVMLCIYINSGQTWELFRWITE